MPDKKRLRIWWKQHDLTTDALPPEDREAWESVAEAMIEGFGNVTFADVGQGRWAVETAQNGPHSHTIGPTSTIPTTPVDRRRELIAALKAAGLPVFEP